MAIGEQLAVWVHLRERGRETSHLFLGGRDRELHQVQAQIEHLSPRQGLGESVAQSMAPRPPILLRPATVASH